MNVIFIFLVLSIEISFSLKCTVQFKRAKVCKIYKYNEDCFMGKVELCEVIAIKKNQNKCPHYICDFFQSSSSAVLLNSSSTTEENQTITNASFTNYYFTSENSSLVRLNNTLKSEVTANQSFQNYVLSENLTRIVLNDTFKSEITTNQSVENSVSSEKLIPIYLNVTSKNLTTFDFKKFLSNENSTNLVSDIIVSENLTNTLQKNTSNSQSASSSFLKPLIVTTNVSSVLFNNSLIRDNSTNLNKNFRSKDKILKSEIEPSAFLNSTKLINNSVKLQNNSFLRTNFKVSSTNNTLLNANQSNPSNKTVFSEHLTTNVTNAILSNSSFEALLSNSLNSLSIPLKNNHINISLPEQTKSESNSISNLNDLKNWKQLESIKNFSKNHILEKSRLYTHFKESLGKQQQKSIDESKSKKITNINELNKSEDFEKSRLPRILQPSVKPRIKQIFFQSSFDRLFSKMPIDCGDKTCSLEFQERKDVS